MASYQLTQSGTTILREVDGAYIPAAPANADYVTYLAWLAAGNTPDPAPVIPNPSIIPVPAFWARFTAAEQAAIEAAAVLNPSIAQTMTFALAVGQVNLLTGPLVLAWMASLVTGGVITAARSAVILTP